MADLVKSQYLDSAGLGVFYGLIKDQWTKADQEQYTKITGEYTEAISVAQKGIWGGESAPTEIGNLTAAENAIKQNVSDIAELVEALAAEIELRASEDAKLLGTSNDAPGIATIHGALNAVAGIVGEAGDQSNNTITGLAFNLGELTETISAEVEARGKADDALSERIDALVTGGVNPEWLSQNWLPVNIDEDSIKVVDGNETTVELPDGTTSTGFTPKLLSSNLTLDIVNNSIVLKSASNDTKTYGSVDLTDIVMDRVLTAGSVIYDDVDAKTGDPGYGKDGVIIPTYPYILFTISAFDKETESENKEYIRVSVKDLVDEYTAEGEIEIVRTDTDAGGEQPGRVIKLTQAFLNRIGEIENDLAAEVEARGKADTALLGTTGDTAGATTIHGALNAVVVEKTRAEKAEVALGERIDALGVIEAIPTEVINSICGVETEAGE